MSRLLVVAWLLLIACNPESKSLKVVSIPTPAGTNSSEPYLFTDADGDVLLSWVERVDTVARLSYARWQGEAWSAPVSIAQSHTWFLNWADYPVIAANKNNLIAHVLDKSDDGKYTYDVKITTSANGAAWSSPLVLHDDGEKAEHGFVSIVPYGDDFFVCWLDGRNTGANTNDHNEHGHGAMSLRAAIVTAHGKKLTEWELDNRTCDCCQTTAAITDAGPVVVYRNRTDEEIRDISITRLINNEWTAPESIYADNWYIQGCPVNGPRAEALNNQLAIAWFTNALDSTKVQVVFSDDNGKTFSGPVVVNTANTIGRVDVVWLDKTRVMVSYVENSKVWMRVVHRSGKLDRPQLVAATSSKRASGFPQLTRSGNQLFFAWTDDEERTIKCASVKELF
ncbi:MAG: exo-alpha-sialidase [Cytophagales bacterium]|nr:exo-alpha-sialidase [Cytophagales bacterium]